MKYLYRIVCQRVNEAVLVLGVLNIIEEKFPIPFCLLSKDLIKES